MQEVGDSEGGEHFCVAKVQPQATKVSTTIFSMFHVTIEINLPFWRTNLVKKLKARYKLQSKWKSTLCLTLQLLLILTEELRKIQEEYYSNGTQDN
jgi:hypothetical protein